jgi:hypothetical protein
MRKKVRKQGQKLQKPTQKANKAQHELTIEVKQSITAKTKLKPNEKSTGRDTHLVPFSQANNLMKKYQGRTKHNNSPKLNRS